MKNQGFSPKELTKREKLDSTSVSPSTVATVTPSKILAYTQILEPTVDLVIDHSLVTYFLFYAFKPPSLISCVVLMFMFI